MGESIASRHCSAQPLELRSETLDLVSDRNRAGTQPRDEMRVERLGAWGRRRGGERRPAAGAGIAIERELRHDEERPAHVRDGVGEALTSFCGDFTGSVIYALPWLVVFWMQHVRPDAFATPAVLSGPLMLALMVIHIIQVVYFAVR